ncbi:MULTISPECIES: hypothetical protein [Streptomyces]|uniref:Integral membrane protein n=1 Tax=Streptomyces cyaneofuscatus TaxID=66883 RepID=A0ABZ1EZD4_9ACTN|nr:hypothetical protein [Streptomyces cyaneofuscatus]WSB09388.1 hypothetical protein OG849_20205 [Streptomyces cyaneofuscatus]WSD47076.1 hypothetical protein OG857_15195 [Streptomyces cyaneofuscatus]
MHRVGIESDQLVYDYLSRVGDLAQQQQLSSGARMRLVSTLRGEIDRRRASEGADSPAAVRRIIDRLGSPAELVGAAAESGDGTVPLPSARTGGGAAVPKPRTGFLRKGPKAPEGPGGPDGRGGPGAASDAASGAASRTGSGPAPRTGSGPGDHPRTDLNLTKPTSPDGTPADTTPWPHPSAPHVLGPDQQSSGEDDWWRLEPGPFDAGTAVPGFFGGIEAPELLGRRPPVKPEAAEKEAGEEEKAPEDGEAGTAAAPRRRAFRIPRPRRRKPVVVAEPVVAAVPAPRGGFAHPLLLLAAVLLVAGVVTGSWIPLAGGWLIAYGSRTLSRTEAKWAALGLPGVVVAGALVWVWGRLDGRWGEPIADGGLREVLMGAWPVVVRIAAVASALYLVWRARRRG